MSQLDENKYLSDHGATIGSKDSTILLKIHNTLDNFQARMSDGKPNPKFTQSNTSDNPSQVEYPVYKTSLNIGDGTPYYILRMLQPHVFVLGMLILF